MRSARANATRARRWFVVSWVSLETRREARVVMEHLSVEEKGVEAQSATRCEETTGRLPPRYLWSVTKVSVPTEVVMPVQLCTEAERAQRHHFPEAIASEDLVTFFPLSARDLARLPRSSAPQHRLGSALRLCTLRFMGLVPDALHRAPPEAVAFVAQQLAVSSEGCPAYGARVPTRQDHLPAAHVPLGSRRVAQHDIDTLTQWLLERALAHDKPALLYALACEKLRTAPLVRPGGTRRARGVAEAREQAHVATLQQLAPLLPDDGPRCLDTLLAPDTTHGMPPRAMVEHLDTRAFLPAAGVAAWSLDTLNPHRRTF